MSIGLDEVMNEVKSLSRVDKLRLIQLLAQDLSGEEEAAMHPRQSYPVWSPESAFAAADQMLQALAADKGHP
jgi:hypothetical protein